MLFITEIHVKSQKKSQTIAFIIRCSVRRLQACIRIQIVIGIWETVKAMMSSMSISLFLQKNFTGLQCQEDC